ncbi:MAG TPA: CopG family transcriptional regulator [Gemmatimonadaceae bacterium]|nr:CopG family transcriptional regulator [Gemmatimonadaceae bacterium]
MATPMRTVSFKLPEDLDEALTGLARRRNASRSALVRDALRAVTAGSDRSVTNVVDQLVKPFDGPADLSTNPKHMTGYGK